MDGAKSRAYEAPCVVLPEPPGASTATSGASDLKAAKTVSSLNWQLRQFGETYCPSDGVQEWKKLPLEIAPKPQAQDFVGEFATACIRLKPNPRMRAEGAPFRLSAGQDR